MCVCVCVCVYLEELQATERQGLGRRVGGERHHFVQIAVVVRQRHHVEHRLAFCTGRVVLLGQLGDAVFPEREFELHIGRSVGTRQTSIVP